jgi:hypothetical protein
MENNTQTIQLIQLTPTELINAIENSVNIKLEELKTSFQPKEPEELLTRSETSSLLKVNLSTLWNWTKKGKLKSYGIGNRVYYKRHEVMQSIINLKN